MIQQSAINDENSFSSDHSDNSVLNKTTGTLKDENINDSNDNDCTFETGNDVSANNKNFNDNKEPEVVTTEVNIDVDNDIEFKKDIQLSRDTYFVENNDHIVDDKKIVISLSRATYCVSSNDDNVLDIDNKSQSNRNSLKYNMAKDSALETDNNNKPNTFINNIISSIKESNLNTQSNNSLTLFEKLEEATKNDTDINSNATSFFNIKKLKEKRNFFGRDDVPKSPETPATVVKCKDRKIYFDNIDNSSNNDEDKVKIDDYRSPSIVKDDVTNNFEPSMIKKLLGQSITNNADNLNALQKIKICDNKNDSIDLFEALDSPQACNKIQDDIENVRKSIQNVAIIPEDAIVCKNVDIEHNQEIVSNVKNDVEETNDNEQVEEIVNNVDVESNKGNSQNKEIISKISIENTDEIKKVNHDESQLQINNTKTDNTLDEFENIYKDITTSRATEFDLLVSQEIKDCTIDTTNTNNETENEDLKYNLRQKAKTDKPKNQTRRGKKVLECSPPKSETAKPKKRNLRLRRRQNASEDNSEDGSKDRSKDESKDIDADTNEKDIGKAKLKDIINLQKEFSDVTLDKPAPAKEFKDIPSPEKNDNENLPPVLGIQSCPAKR